MADLTPGTVLDERFEVHGVVGRGGTATVYLAMDRLRGHRVALKVVHPHLADDPGVRGRMQSEVQAATAVRHQGALVPYDLHEIGGQLTLILPFHPGQTLAERIATEGALSPDELRALGERLATVLAAAHRGGVLHRDITANNVMLGADPAEAVITDFGLARVTQLHRNRTTGLLGTAGYAAPEVYAGERADPRSDLYGLGAVLYLAATGQPAFDPAHPMGGLQQQLDEAWRPLAEARPDLPADLVATIEALLRRDPDRRPQGAREVLDALERRVSPEQPDTSTHAGETRPTLYLPRGGWTVVVRETDDDQSRRKLLRVDARKARSTTESEFLRWGKQIANTVRDALGIEVATPPSPEELLAGAMAEEAGLPPDAVAVNPGVLHKRFRLIDDTDEETARRLAAAARDFGFKARATRVGGPPALIDRLIALHWVPIALAWSLFPFLISDLGLGNLLVLNISLSILLPVGAKLWRDQRPATDDLPVAYRGDLRRALGDGDHPPPRFTTVDPPATDPAPIPPPPSSRGETLGQRASAALDRLAAAVEDQAAALPELAAVDLRSTLKDLRARTEELARDVDRLSLALDQHGIDTTDVTWMQDRLDRLRTLARAGETTDPAETARLEAALSQHQADVAAAERVQTQLTATSAQLLEIASTASRVRRDLLSETPTRHSADALVARLRGEAQAAEAARKEADEARKEAARRKRAAQGLG